MFNSLHLYIYIKEKDNIMKIKKINKICFVVPSLHKGGLERVTSILANQAIYSKIEVSIIILTPGLKVEYELDKNIDIYEPSFNYKRNIFFKLRVLSFLFKKVKLISPDVIISFSENFNPLSILVGRFLSTRVFISDRSSPLLKINFINRILKKISYPFATGILAQTELAKKKLDNLNNNVFVIPNPIRYINDSYDKQEDKIIISVGRLVKSKNFKELIRIFKNINKLDWQLLILGDGPQYNELLDFIHVNNLEENVFLKGNIDDVDLYFAKSSIFAFTSLSEGFPNALNEAMSFPLATIAYNCIAGPSDLIVDNINGYLVEEGDIESYTDKLYDLMTDRELRQRFCNEGIKNRKKFSQDIIFIKLLNCIRK